MGILVVMDKANAFLHATQCRVRLLGYFPCLFWKFHMHCTVDITEAALNCVDTEKFKPTGIWPLDSVSHPSKSIRMIQNGLLNKAQ